VKDPGQPCAKRVWTWAVGKARNTSRRGSVWRRGANEAARVGGTNRNYHKQVHAQLSGPQESVILDFEPMRAGKEECAGALRLLRRLGETYGPRFFELVVVDSWYAQGPFLKAVVEELADMTGRRCGISGTCAGRWRTTPLGN
jgi:hypothetical protein